MIEPSRCVKAVKFKVSLGCILGYVVCRLVIIIMKILDSDSSKAKQHIFLGAASVIFMLDKVQ